MARPLKEGVDYWTEDGNFYSNKKIRLLRSEFGSNGMYILNYIMCELYTNHGYYENFDMDWCGIVSDGAVCGGSPNFVAEFIKGCVRRSFFDKRVFDSFSVITSKEIQRRYIRMVCTRNQIRLIKEYCLLDFDDPLDVPDMIREKIVLKSVSDTENSVIDIGNPINYSGNTQSKVKESKVKKSKEKNTLPAKTGMQSVSADAERRGSSTAQSIIDIFHSICVSYPKVRSISDARKKAIQARLRVHGADIIREVFEKAESSDFLRGKNDRNWSADFDWIMADRNFAKILDGKYDNRGGNNAKSERTDTHTDELKGIRYL